MTPTPDGASPAGAAEHEDAGGAWRIVLLLALANLLNFYDRALPAVVVEPIKAEFGLDDTAVGLLSGAFTVVYALSGIVLGRLADKRSRRLVMGLGLIVWSAATAGGGLATAFGWLLLFRLAVGVGEASYAPAANSMIADLFPADRRSRAVAVFQLGLPVGTLVAFFTTGLLVEAFDSWRAPFVLAGIPGLVLAVLVLRMPQPRRGGMEDGAPRAGTARRVRDLARTRTLQCLVLSGAGLQMAGYAAAAFLVPLFQRYYGQSLTAAGINAGIILGVTGIVGLAVAGVVGERASRRSRAHRTAVGAVALLLSAPLTAWALTFPPEAASAFVVVFGLGWLLQFCWHTTALPAVSDVVEPASRGTAIALVFAASALLGAGAGPVLVGALSDAFASGAASGTAVSAQADGLRRALLAVVPAALVLSAAGLAAATRAVGRDYDAMQVRLAKAR